MNKTVVELFAGVGGFRIGLNKITNIGKDGVAIENGDFSFVWANQWEPSTTQQHAFECYNTRFPSNHNSNVDISLVDKKSIPNHSLLCGGFPCQDYSVAHSLSTEKGIEGKKGVLWWQIRDILIEKQPPFVLLENVDRLLKSPAKQRGRDFGIMLKCFAELDYIVEWRVICASDYAMPQRRRRIYIFASKKNTHYANTLTKNDFSSTIFENGLFAKTFPIKQEDKIKSIALNTYHDLVDFSNHFKFEFENSGVLVDNIVYTSKTSPIYEGAVPLKEILQHNVDNSYYLTEAQVDQFAYLRGSKKILRYKPNGEEYYYSEGAMSEYDDIELPGRTMLTSERSINRSTHVIIDPEKNLPRFLTPVECERMNQFPDEWTNSGMPEKRRYFMMGNALVCGIVKRLGKKISKIIDEEQ